MSAAPIDRAYIEDVLAQANAIAAQPRCSCSVGVATHDETVAWLQWYRCKVCAGLVSTVRVLEGTAHVIDGTIQ